MKEPDTSTPEPDDEGIDYSDIPPITDWRGAIRGPWAENRRILRERRERARVEAQ